MKIKIFGCLIGFILTAAACSAQSQTESSVRIDSIESVPTLAELRVLILKQDQTQQGESIKVPTQHRALFCRFDDKLDKKKIPLRMRLGSLEEVNRMESKPGFRTGQVPN